MFLFTLAEEAEEWFYSLPVGSITSWEEMEKAFLNEYFPASVFLRKRYEILNFKQKDGETLGDNYKRLKIVLVACPTHNMDPTEQMHMFVNGLKIKTKQLIDTTADASINFSTATGIKKIIEVIAANEHLELYNRCQSKPEGVIDLKLETNKIRIEDIIDVEVDKKLKAMNIGTQQVAQVQLAPTVYCEICNGTHQTVYCFETPQKVEEIKFLKQNNPCSNTYNPAHNVQFQEETRNNKKNTIASIKNLEVQMGQIVQQLTSSSQAQGALPSATVTYPREHNNVSTVTTRNGKSDEVVEEVDEEEG
ncbi:uncharacterized protein LOC127094593 [Lathyrus oleraceus]|uniref:uncharacterized protein LOC127094593 n=1 Tax=Pisum sativum TaxID=3888 RepID=UPI0021D3D255|nr:uncharacterized protein LOC127094593 [Pisum sativum]